MKIENQEMNNRSKPDHIVGVLSDITTSLRRITLPHEFGRSWARILAEERQIRLQCVVMTLDDQ
jgi:hypothetical protein